MSAFDQIGLQSEQGDLKRAAISLTGTGSDQAIVAAVSGKKIRVVSMCLASSADGQNTILKSGTTALMGAASLGTTLPLVLPHNPVGWVETATGEALNITTTVSANWGGWICYLEV